MHENLPNVDEIESGVFDRLFKDLDSPQGQGMINSVKTTFQVNGRDIFAAKDHTGNLHLLVPNQEVLGTDPIIFSNHLSARRRDLAGSTGHSDSFIDVECSSINSLSVFAGICFDIATQLQNVTTHTIKGLALITSVIEQWRELFLKSTLKEPTDNEKLGFIGELLLLQGLESQVGLSQAMRAWTGLEKSRHDFELLHLAVECKSSFSLGSKTCVIHGLHQLSSTEDTSLYLVHLQMERSSQGISVSSILNELEDRHTSIQDLRQKILENFAVIEEPSWFSSFAVKLVACSLYKVNEKFPRVTASSLNKLTLNAMMSIEYRLNLSSTDFEVSASSIEPIVNELFSNV